MPSRQRGSYSRKGFGLRPVDSMKNVVHEQSAIGVTATENVVALAVDNPLNTVNNQIQRGSTIKNIWVSLDFCGLSASGVQVTTHVYIIKNPGSNLVPPVPGTEGTSNEKKFIFKEWNQMTMRNQDGNPPYHWEGWVKIPKRYQRMGADDRISIITAITVGAGHFTMMCIYKWFR